MIDNTQEIYRTMKFQEWLINEQSHKFSCAMIPLDSIAKKLLAWSKKHIPDKNLCLEEGGRDKENHVTALYGLHSESIEDIKPILKKFKPFEIHLGKVSKFGSDKYDVIKLEITSPTLHAMNTALKKLPYSCKYPDYKPHCTIAYVKSGSCDDLIGNKDFDKLHVKANAVIFSTSSGNKTKIVLS